MKDVKIANAFTRKDRGLGDVDLCQAHIFHKFCIKKSWVTHMHSA